MDPEIVNDPRYADSLVSDLQSLRTLSLVLDVEDVWGESGFYANPQQSGLAWERAVSVELLDTDGTGLFQQDAGIRIMGSGSTNRALGKKSMRLVFRDEYGESKLLYPFFGADYTDEINSIAIRGNYFDTWTFQSDSGGLGGACCGRSRSSYLRDQFAHLTHEEMGAHAIAGNWVHLYINGQYWGIYNPTERPDDEFMQSYFGGNDTDYDVIKTGVELVDGTLDGWNTMMNIALGNGANGSLANSAAYEELKQYLDMEQFADYLLLNFWGGNHDWPHNNWYAVRDRVDNSQFTFILWDAENFLFSVNSNRTGVSNNNSPGVIYDRLRQNAEFNQLFADRVQKHFFNGGALSTQATTQRFQEIVDTIRPALNAEAARWGDELTPNAPYNVIDHYDPFVQEKLANYFPVRTNIVLGQLRSAGLFPSTSFESPSFSQHGGVLATGQSLAISNAESSGTLYYTLDGSDPRLAGGAISGSAIAYSGAFQLPDHATVIARLLRFGTWSAKIEADFVIADVVADASNLRVTEVHYNPVGPSAAELTAGFTDGDQFEFIEFINTSNDTISLDGVELIRTVVGNVLDGITFDFGLVALAPGERIVVVSDLAAFTQRYGSSINIAGQYAGNLANAGETVRLLDAQGAPIQQFKYDDDAITNWPTTPDGDGPSLVVFDNTGDYDNGNNWIASTTTHGTPGSAEAAGIIGDVNGDGFVGAADLDQILATWGDAAGASPQAAQADLDQSGTVGSGDLSIVINNFGNGTPPTQPTSNGNTPDDNAPGNNATPGTENSNSAGNNNTDANTNGNGNSSTGNNSPSPTRPNNTPPTRPNNTTPSDPGGATTIPPTRPARQTQPAPSTRPTRPGEVRPARDNAQAPAAPTRPALERPSRAAAANLTATEQRAAANTQPPDALALAKPKPATPEPTQTINPPLHKRKFNALAFPKP